MAVPTIYLDNNHLSDLIFGPEYAVMSTMSILAGGRALLAISLWHIVELSRVSPERAERVRAFMRSVPIRLAIDTGRLRDDEIAYAIARLRGFERRPPRVFVRTLTDWAPSHTAPLGYSAVDFFEIMHRDPAYREAMMKTPREGAEIAVMMREHAAVVRDLLEPLTKAVADHLDEWRWRQRDYAAGLTAREIVDAIGENVCPSAAACNRLARVRLLDKSKADPNDIVDEDHAAYAPYAAVLATDGPTAHRFRQGKVPASVRVTSRLNEVAPLFERVMARAVAPPLLHQVLE